MRELALFAILLGLVPGCAITQLWAPTREQVLYGIRPSSVQILLEQGGRRFRSASGVVIAAWPAAYGAECLVLTSGHTLARLSGHETEIFVLFGRDRGAGTKARASLVARRENDEVDLALLRVQTETCVAAQLGSPPTLGDPIWIVAFPWGRNMTLVGGIVSQVNAEVSGDSDNAPRLMVDASVSYGASGGGVYEARTGRLIGLVEGYRTARVSLKGDAETQYIDVPVPGETYVTPLMLIRRFLSEAGYPDVVRGAQSKP